MLYKCTDCEGTVPACRHRISVGGSLREARVEAVQQGVAPPEVEWLRGRFAEHDSPYAVDLQRRAQSGRPREGCTGVVPACTSLVHQRGEFPRVMRLLDMSSAEVTTALPDPGCCGYPLDAAGLREEFVAHAKRVAKSLERYERLAVQGAACAWTMSVRYRELGVRLKPEVVPLVDLLAGQAPRWRKLVARQPAPSRRYAYHDPCFLARRLGRVEQPRDALRAVGIDPVELDYRAAETQCAGGGGVYPLTHPDAAQACARGVGDLLRAAVGPEQARETVLVSGCPSAVRRLRQAEPELEVRSLPEVLEERLLGE